jgi:BOP1NT (NUC169) domain
VSGCQAVPRRTHAPPACPGAPPSTPPRRPRSSSGFLSLLCDALGTSTCDGLRLAEAKKVLAARKAMGNACVVRARRVVKLVRALRKGWIKRAHERLPAEEEPAYLMWEDDGRVNDKTANGLTYIPAPKPKLPGHEESYNPPKEYLPTEVRCVLRTLGAVYLSICLPADGGPLCAAHAGRWCALVFSWLGWCARGESAPSRGPPQLWGRATGERASTPHQQQRS